MSNTTTTTTTTDATGDVTSTTASTLASQDDATNIDAVTYSMTNFQTVFTAIGTVGTVTSNIMTGFYNQMTQLWTGLQAGVPLTDNQSTAFGVLATSALGAKKAFEQLAGVDMTSLNTFSKQWAELSDTIANSPFAKTAGAGIALLKDSLIKMGAPIASVEQAVAGGVKSLVSYGNAFVDSADNALKLQNSMIQYAAQTGTLNNLYSAAGAGLKDLNELTVNYSNAISDATMATGVSTEVMQGYYGLISQIPGALASTVQSADKTAKSVSMLTAATQFAIGSGRSEVDVAKDLGLAFKDYGISGEAALKFTAQMTEISNKFHVELSDVRSALSNTADSFKMFGNEAEGAANMMNQYLGALQSTGLGEAASLSVIQKMTDGIKGLNIAQKSFLSAQSGGPGGLMGGYKIEQLLQSGQMDKVMAMVRTTLTKQMGPLVSLDQASQSPQAAAQMTKQIAMLRQGPLGSFAADDQSAIKLIEAMRNQQMGIKGAAASALSATPAQDLMSKGIDWQAKTHTVVVDILSEIKRIQGLAAISNLTTVQKSATAGVGAQFGATGDYSGQLRLDLGNRQKKAGTASGATAAAMADALKTGMLSHEQTIGKSAAMSMTDSVEVAKMIPESLKAPMDNIKSMINAGSQKGTAAIYKESINRLDAQTKDLKNTQMADQNAPLIPPPVEPINTGDIALDKINNIRDLPAFATPDAAMTATQIANKKNAPTAGSLRGMPAPDTTDGKNLGSITVHIEGFCLDCGEKIKGHSQSHAVAPQTK